MNVAKKQFVITNKKLNIEDMTEINLSKGFLYADKELSLTVAKNSVGAETILLGNAFVANIKGRTAEEDIKSWDGQSVEDLTYDWTGRWVVIAANEISSDPACLMSLFYYTENGSYIISSSLALISKITGKKTYKTVSSRGLSWQLLPYTIVEDVKKVSTFQKIIIDNDNIVIKARSWYKQYQKLSTDEKVEEFANLLKTSMKNMETFSGRELYLALTGGKDSRVTFSALLASDVKNFKTYLFEHDNMLKSDKVTPKKISKAFNLDFHYIKKCKSDKAKENEYVEFTAGNSRDADLNFYKNGQFGQLPQNAIILRSGFFETGSLYYENAVQDLQAWVENAYNEIKQDENQMKALKEWVEFTKEFPLPNVDGRYRFYLEQRVGGWASAIEQSMDLNNFISIQIADNAHILSLLLSATAEERRNKVFTYKTIKLLEPRLLNYSFNKKSISDYCRLIKNKLRRG